MKFVQSYCNYKDRRVVRMTLFQVFLRLFVKRIPYWWNTFERIQFPKQENYFLHAIHAGSNSFWNSFNFEDSQINIIKIPKINPLGEGVHIQINTDRYTLVPRATLLSLASLFRFPLIMKRCAGYEAKFTSFCYLSTLIFPFLGYKKCTLIFHGLCSNDLIFGIKIEFRNAWACIRGGWGFIREVFLGGFTAFQKCIRDWLLMKTSYPRKKDVPVTNGDVGCNLI